MAKTNDELRQEVSDMLVLFVDFIYALVFWQIVSETYNAVIDKEAGNFMEWTEKVKSVVAIFAIFYFLVWDWIGGRILTVKNPYRGFTRFFTESLIAFCAYGAVLEIVKQRVFCLCYIAVMLSLGVLWAKRTIREYPESSDLHELRVIAGTHGILAIIVISSFFFVRYDLGQTHLTARIVGFILAIEWHFILIYEILIPRAPGILGGPQMSFISRGKIRYLRDLLASARKILIKKKGSNDE